MPKEQENEVVKDLSEVEHEDDFFEKLLKEEIDPLADADDDTDTSKKTTSSKEEAKEDDKQTKDDDGETVESLRAKIAEMERERKGQLDSVVKSRQERARFKSELSQLKDAVSSLLAQREKDNALNLDEEDDKEKAPLSDPKATVNFTENGDSAYVDLTEVKKAIESGHKATRAELDALKAEKAAEAAKAAFIENVQSVIDQNKEVYSVAYQNLGKIYEGLNNKIIELQERTGEYGDNGVLSQDQALDLFIGSPEEAEFQKEFPGIDPTRVARAFNTKVDLKIGLSHLADALKIGAKADDKEDGLDEKLLKAKGKPGGLASHGNQKPADTGDLVARIATLSASDVEDLSDAEVAKIEQMLLREELQNN